MFSHDGMPWFPILQEIAAAEVPSFDLMASFGALHLMPSDDASSSLRARSPDGLTRLAACFALDPELLKFQVARYRPVAQHAMDTAGLSTEQVGFFLFFLMKRTTDHSWTCSAADGSNA